MSKFYEDALLFAKEHILPYAKEIDEKMEFPVESFKEIGKAGYFKLMIPTELGDVYKRQIMIIINLKPMFHNPILI